MAQAMKKCRVCGKEYPACKTFKRIPGVFRWQDVACSPECGAKYLRAVMIARGELVEEAPTEEVVIKEAYFDKMDSITEYVEE